MAGGVKESLANVWHTHDMDGMDSRVEAGFLNFNGTYSIRSMDHEAIGCRAHPLKTWRLYAEAN